jgi:hypothetical protein
MGWGPTKASERTFVHDLVEHGSNCSSSNHRRTISVGSMRPLFSRGSPRLLNGCDQVRLRLTEYLVVLSGEPQVTESLSAAQLPVALSSLFGGTSYSLNG